MAANRTPDVARPRARLEREQIFEQFGRSVADIVEVRSLEDFEDALATIVTGRPDALYIDGGSLAYARRQQIADFALAHRLPGTYGLKAYAQAGLLMTYGLNNSRISR